MIVLTLEPGEDAKLAEGAPGLQRKYGMPIDPAPYPRTFSSEPACRAVVAARLNAPGAEAPLLRRLRVRAMVGGLLDDPALIAAAARDVGLDRTSWRAGRAMPAVEDALRPTSRRALALPRRPRARPQARRPGVGAPLHGAELRAHATAAASRSRASTRSRPTRPRWPTSGCRGGRSPNRSSSCSPGRASHWPRSR